MDCSPPSFSVTSKILREERKPGWKKKGKEAGEGAKGVALQTSPATYRYPGLTGLFPGLPEKGGLDSALPEIRTRIWVFCQEEVISLLSLTLPILPCFSSPLVLDTEIWSKGPQPELRIGDWSPPLGRELEFWFWFLVGPSSSPPFSGGPGKSPVRPGYL